MRKLIHCDEISIFVGENVGCVFADDDRSVGLEDATRTGLFDDGDGGSGGSGEGISDVCDDVPNKVGANVGDVFVLFDGFGFVEAKDEVEVGRNVGETELPGGG